MTWRLPIAAALCLVVVAGCGLTGTSSSGMSYPAGASLEQFGLRDRCPPEPDCSERAMEAIQAALGRLGPEILNTPIRSNGVEAIPEDRLYVEVTIDPMLEWRTTTGQEGGVTAFRIDLTDEHPYVVVAPRYSFRLSEEDASAIRDALFVAR
jgi:hypothetical protein